MRCTARCYEHFMRNARPSKPLIQGQNIPGMALVAELPHKHGSSVFIRDGRKVNNISVCEEENVELITVELPGVVHSICTNHHLNHSDSLHWEKETSLTS